jgi:electron transport complex protein RnfB
MNVTLIAIVTVGGLSLLFGVALAVASRFLTVEVDPKIERIYQVLPHINCGACGYPGCQSFAEAVARGDAPVGACPVGGAKVASEVGSVIGVKEEDKEPMRAIVRCQGGKGIAKDRFEYTGVRDCKAAELVVGGHKACIYGCLGMGSCVKACPFGAMTMGEDGLPVVFEDKCTGCTLCVPACPRDIMDMLARSQSVFVACVSKDKGKKVKDVCSLGCTGCRLCANPKVTPSGAITMDGNLPKLDYSKGDAFEMAVQKCPQNCYLTEGETYKSYYEKRGKGKKEEVLEEAAAV